MQIYPGSRSYFASLTPDQLKELETPPDFPAGWFLYHIDLFGDRSPASRQLFFQTFMNLLIQGGLFVISSPIDYYINVNKGLGFKEVPEAGHADFGQDLWSTTLDLDIRGDKLNAYIKNMLITAGVRFDPIVTETMFGLTDREREVANMLLVCTSNEEIAGKLHVTKITIKKHLSRVYEKANVNNRTEFQKKLMSMV